MATAPDSSDIEVHAQEEDLERDIEQGRVSFRDLGEGEDSDLRRKYPKTVLLLLLVPLLLQLIIMIVATCMNPEKVVIGAISIAVFVISGFITSFILCNALLYGRFFPSCFWSRLGATVL
ncbi:protein A12 [Aotine betaherpesvirus 1]|uniref:Protein A12 n=1 Tax=Aotine betaherpesvirus 1 TaxID=50290 RepID=G8XU85_9BETA|nr:protein A12 [Aotine betaherpesvirus 1]AEV80822.1 protein A12 [Aotine betaherpesvirus 1]